METTVFSFIENRVRSILDGSNVKIWWDMPGLIIQFNDDEDWLDNMPAVLQEIAETLADWQGQDEEVCVNYQHIPESDVYQIIVGDAQAA
jgi:hypothetical protein